MWWLDGYIANINIGGCIDENIDLWLAIHCEPWLWPFKLNCTELKIEQ